MTGSMHVNTDKSFGVTGMGQATQTPVIYYLPDPKSKTPLLGNQAQPGQIKAVKPSDTIVTTVGFDASNKPVKLESNGFNYTVNYTPQAKTVVGKNDQITVDGDGWTDIKPVNDKN